MRAGSNQCKAVPGAALAGILAGCAPGGETGAGESDDELHGSYFELVREVRGLVEESGVEPVEDAPDVRDELFELGQALAFDKELSGNRNISCMTCHHPELATADHRSLPRGEGGAGLGPDREGGHIVPRHSQPLFNLHARDTQFWDGRVQLLEGGEIVTPADDEITAEMRETFEFGAASAQAMFPVTSHVEMRGLPGDNEIADAESLTEVWSGLMDRLGAIDEYVAMFEAAYPGEDFDDMTFAHAANAIAGFEIQAFEATSSPWQWFLRGDDVILTPDELRGAREFLGGGCAECHGGPGLSDGEHHAIALPQFGPGKGHGPLELDDFGREGVTGDAGDRYAFRTPMLDNVGLTGPYGHAGQFSDLESLGDHYTDPAASLENYEIRDHVSDSALWPSVLDTSEELLENLAPEVAAIEIQDPDALLVFLRRALTDPTSHELTRFIPDEVPSGLPVED